MMNKAASELSFAPFFPTKDEFLTHLAKTYFGSDYLNAVKAWKFFEKGYVNFPVNLAFEWVGPMQDSPCCPLHLIPADWPMPGTWLKSEMSGGDRIGECLLNGHTIDEALTLVERINSNWEKGLKYFIPLNVETNQTRAEQISNASAIGLIFKSGYNVLLFYKLRHLLGTRQGDAKQLLEQMKNIVLEEISISTALIPITENDNRIGYHSEANGYKIFPAKLKWRIEKLEELLKTEFVQVEQNIESGKLPLNFYYGLHDPSKRYVLGTCDNSPWKYFTLENGETDFNTAIKAFDNGEFISLQINLKGAVDNIEIKPEFNIMFPTIPFYVKNDKFIINRAHAYSITNEDTAREMRKFKFKCEILSENERVYTIKFARKTFNMAQNEPFRLLINRSGSITSSLLQSDEYFTAQLIRGELSPGKYCFFIKEN
jgi:hypothetical protein